MTYSVDDLASAKRLGVLLRVASGTPIRLWSGQVRDLVISSGGAETTDGAIYQSHGQLGSFPTLDAALSGDAQRLDFAMSGAAITGEIAALATNGAAEIRGKAVDLGVLLFDADWQPMFPLLWPWSGTADSLTVEKSAGADPPVRTLRLSVGNVFTARKRPNQSFFTDIDQKRLSPTDDFFSEVSKYYPGTTKVWGTG